MAEISTIARPYSVGLFSLAKETKKLGDWSEMLNLMSVVIKNKEISSIINDPKHLDIDKENLLLSIFDKKITKEGSNFIRLLIENKRLNVLPVISEMFHELKDADEGTIEAELIFAIDPPKKEIEALIKSLEKKFNKKIEAKILVDEKIIGGAKILVGDTFIDASIKGQLENLAYNLRA
jgi:F-type H+-transporting ATPase subunit delta|tara:strand:+ start:428 stop:964 length:537 start_codon:yes stop_codon:yes gene_type:complete